MTNPIISSLLSIHQAIAVNKAFLKVSPPLERVEPFRVALLDLLKRVELGETEGFHKNLVIEFFRQTFKGEMDKNTPYFINTKNYAQGEGDLVIHTGKTADSSVGVILEFKAPQGKLSEMPKPNQLNVKALQQLLFYFLQERLAGNNLEVKKLVITNIYKWFIFDTQDFERLFVESLGKKFEDFTAGRLTGKTTEFFYQQIAKPAIADVERELKFVYFDLREHRANLETVTDEGALVALFKIFSPEYLLKLPLANDSNRLDEGFYNELLHIMGLTVVKVNGKKLIDRQAKKDRHRGSLLENAIAQLQSLDKLSRLSDPLSYGETAEAQVFGVALALVIVWINRILFLKLLEAQLLSYHKQEKAVYRFLNSEKIRNYGDLQQLFFEVLAVPAVQRDRSLLARFARIPYLNSSLFEPTDLEQEMIFMSNLREESLPLFKGTILRDEQGKSKTGEMNTLAYLFAFLNAYDFGSEEGGVIKKDQKRLISSSVLGLIFERINGYKDGSFFTPAFITMYMCRETIRRAVLQKFNEVKDWHCETLTDLYNEIRDKQEANKIINSLKICDPAVGSGHFLVSALNEIIAIKSELGILMDRSGKVLRDYRVEVANDELIVTDEDAKFFEYNPNSEESQRVQETLFHEKQTIIENCLFGVDINMNSVKICQLRLWIELLKNAYYKSPQPPLKRGADSSVALKKGANSGVGLESGANTRELETLPNIDINIKRGNSLINRFALDSDLGPALRKNDLDVVTYRNAVQTYRNAENKRQKQEMVRLINQIKGNFKTTLFGTDPNKVKLRQLEAELYHVENQTVLFEESKGEEKAREKKIIQLQNGVDKLRAAIEEVESGRLYENALEWRFEFPEVLNDQGDFVGFDVIIGNPPYMAIQDLIKLDNKAVSYYRNAFKSAEKGNFDIYILFIEMGSLLLNQVATLSLILPSKFLTTDYGHRIRQYLLEYNLISEIIDFEAHQVFDIATTYTCIIFLDRKEKNALQFFQTEPSSLIHKENYKYSKLYSELLEKTWILDNDQYAEIVKKVKADTISLKEMPCMMSRGSSTGNDKIFIIRPQNERFVNGYGEDVEVEQEILVKPIYATDFSRYLFKNNTEEYLLFPYYFDNQGYQLLKETFIQVHYPKAYQYLLNNKIRLQQRRQSKIWYAYSAARSLKNHLTADILIPLLADRGLFALNPQSSQYTLMAGGGFSINIQHKEIDKRFLLALLNSKLIFFILCRASNKFRGGYITCTKQYFEELPIKIVNRTLQKPFIKLVDQILLAKKANPNADTTALEAECDRLVYELYGLTDEEIAIIENSQ